MLRNSFLVALLAIVSLSAHAQSPTKPKKAEGRTMAAIRAVLDSQREAWNRGDIEGYMDGYARSEATVFVSGDNLTRGWQTVLERYKKGYDSREKMGTLTFSEVEISLTGNFTAIVSRPLASQTV